MTPEPTTKSIIKTTRDLTARVNMLFASKTPAQFIKTRPGPSGLVIRYVEIGYVINELNRAFGPFWEFIVVDKKVGKKQVWVQGRLCVKDPKSGFSITKESFGGADIKVSKTTSEPIDIANDLKAAVSDCTKKCASMFGIAADVFFKEQSSYDQLPAEVGDESEAVGKILMRKFMAVATERGFNEETIHDIILKKYNLKSRTELTQPQLQEIIEKLETNYQVVSDGESPRRIVTGPQPSASEAPQPSEEQRAEQEINEAEEDEPAVLNTECYQCKKPLSPDSFSPYFCSQECQDEYWKNDKLKGKAGGAK